jgi:tetratricopeptide (TPR) repeat protein
LSNKAPTTESTPAAAAAGPLAAFGRLRAWATGHWLRGLIVASTILTLIGVTIGAWAYLATVAISAGQVTVESALAAFDAGRFEEARSGVTELLSGGRLNHNEYGGPLFVLGALKIKDAEVQGVADRRRVEYLIASRYLTEARAYGLPKDREAIGSFLLGKSLIEGGQFDDGAQVLRDLIAAAPNGFDAVALETHQLLTETCLVMPKPELEEALQHNKAVIENGMLSPEQRLAAFAQRVECLSRLERYGEAREVVASLPSDGIDGATAALARATITLDEFESGLRKVALSDRAQAVNAAADIFAAVLADLQKAASLDVQKGRVTQIACLQTARCLALKDDADGALKQYGRVRQLSGASYEGLAATLGEANVYRRKGEYETAILGYRRALEQFGKIPVYRSHAVPLELLRDNLKAAWNDLVAHQRYSDALSLGEHFVPPFSREEQLELQGNALERWGLQMLGDAGEESLTTEDRAAALEHLRAAGVAFEQLAQLRFATKFYTSDLWRAAEDFFQGHCFSRTIDALRKYLKYEPELRNAQALLRLGQAHLALNHLPECTSLLEECIEFHPLDSSTFQARVDCAKAYWCQGNTEQAERLLRDNIAGSTLKPLSPEWKDSLFELGMLLHEKERFEEAIGTLEEAVERYPHDSQSLVAQYVIGESYRRWAQDLMDAAQQSRSSSEQSKTRQQITQHLTTSLNHFEDVQRNITLKTHDIHSDPLMGTMLRNCYMLEGTVLYDLGRYKEAIEAYSNVSSLYPDEPFVLETFVQIANCWRRLDRTDNARGAVRQAQIVLDRLPENSDFASTTVLSREEWRMLLANMSKW